MRKIAVIDSETDPFKFGRIPEPFIWGFYDGERYLEFEDTDDLVDFLECEPLIVYAHNGGRFDYHFMLHRLCGYDNVKIIGGRLAKFKIGVCEFRDSFNIIPVPLSAYQKTDIDYDKMEAENRQEHMDEIRAYLKDDCVFLYELVTGFIDQYGCHLTQATASMKTWQKMMQVKPPQSDQIYYESFSRFYYGGRVQCFQTGVINEAFKVADINSAYPTAMLDQHPIGVDYEICDGSYSELYSADIVVGNYFYVVRCVSAGAFPYRMDDGSLGFPTDSDKRVYSVTGWELKAAIDTNTITDFEILEVWKHFQYTSFEDYITHFYERRKAAKAAGDVADTLFCKLLMNSLYGKFGANPENYSNFIIIPPDAVPTDNLTRGRNLDSNLGGAFDFSGMLGPWVLGTQDLEDEEKRYYNIAPAASITGWVRAYLWRAINRATGVLYCDTDSIAARDFDLTFGNELGQWEIEGEFSEGAIAGKKLYAFKHEKTGEFKLATKGVRLTADEVYEVARGGVVHYQPEAPSFSIHSSPRFVERDVKKT